MFLVCFVALKSLSGLEVEGLRTMKHSLRVPLPGSASDLEASCAGDRSPGPSDRGDASGSPENTLDI
jgi:hypothetical protein